MRLYAQWIDGAYIRLSLTASGYQEDHLTRQTDAILKLHALFGTNIVLGHIHPIDSPVVLNLFNDPSFRAFIRSYPRFLQLAGYPDDMPSATRYQIATAGLYRALVPGWVSSTFPTPNATQEFADGLLNTGVIDVDRQLHDENSAFNRVVKNWPERRKLLEGALYALDHFANRSDAPVLPAPLMDKPVNLYTILCDTLENPDLSPQHLKYLEITRQFVDDYIDDPSERARQSVIWTTLEERLSPKHPNYKTIKHTVNHAWNAAVVATHQPDGGSLGYLPRSAPVGLYLDEPTDALLPLNIRRGKYNTTSFRRRVPLIIDWDPARLSWAKVVRATGETSDSANRFQQALLSGNNDTIRNTLEEHVQALARHLAPETPDHLLPPWTWIIGPVVAYIIAPILRADLSEVLKATDALKMTEVSILYLLRRGRIYLVTNTLRKAGKQITLQHRNLG